MRHFLALCLSGILLFPACRTESVYGVEVGDIAPPIAATDIHGDEFKLEDLRGSYVLVKFWGSWCGPCIQEAPYINAIYSQYQDRGLEVVSIAIEKNDKNWKKAAQRLGFNWPHQFVEVSRYVRFSELASDYNVTDIPSNFLLDPEGRVIASYATINELTALLEQKL